MINVLDNYTKFKDRDFTYAQIKSYHFIQGLFYASDYTMSNFMQEHNFEHVDRVLFKYDDEKSMIINLFKIALKLEKKVDADRNELDPLFNSCHDDEMVKNLYEAMKGQIDDYLNNCMLLLSFYVMFG